MLLEGGLQEGCKKRESGCRLLHVQLSNCATGGVFSHLDCKFHWSERCSFVPNHG